MPAGVGVATEMFTMAVIAMVVFFVVWCLQSLGGRMVRRGANPGLRSESEARGLRLLRSWLSSAQLRSYEKHGWFDVVGNDSGSCFRIHHGVQVNVEELDDKGRPICAWCFVPEGDLMPGDVMLAQKIALETNERDALAVAIRYPTLRNVPTALRGFAGRGVGSGLI